jgi:hypothetical protein
MLISPKQERINKKKTKEIKKKFNTPTRRLNNADLPTFGLPTIAILGRRLSGIYHSKETKVQYLIYFKLFGHKKSQFKF